MGSPSLELTLLALPASRAAVLTDTHLTHSRGFLAVKTSRVIERVLIARG